MKRYVGEWAYAIRLSKKIHTYRLRGENWTVIYIGDETYFHHLQYILFPEGVSPELIGQTPLWQVPTAAKSWLKEADLVVCGLAPKHPAFWRPSAPYSFRCPVWIDQAIDIRQSLEEQIGGPERRDFRSRLRRSEKVGFAKRVTLDRAEFDDWYINLHLPLIQRQFGQLADTEWNPEIHWKGWIEPGGELLLIDFNDKTIAGATVQYDGDNCIVGKVGFSADPLVKETEKAQLAAWAFAIERAREKGMAKVTMGWSLSRYNNRVLKAKRDWGATIIPTGMPGNPEWTFLANQLNEPLRTHLNELGLITLDGKRNLVVQIPGQDGTYSSDYFGVDGVLVIGEGHNTAKRLEASEPSQSNQPPSIN